MNKTNIDWADSSWNPVTGCLHNCEYCYARGIARRFEGYETNLIPIENRTSPAYSRLERRKGFIYDLRLPFYRKGKSGKVAVAPYPFGFEPTFHRYHLDEYANKKGRTIFVGSMADLFGEWVPDEWIQEVFAACERAPWHRYLFLTKNPKRYRDLINRGLLPKRENMWYGATHTGEYLNTPMVHPVWNMLGYKTFLSIEPLVNDNLPNFALYDEGWLDWTIVGAETGNHKSKLVPERKWIEDIVNVCRDYKIPVFMKKNLAKVWGEELIQEYPEGIPHGNLPKVPHCAKCEWCVKEKNTFNKTRGPVLLPYCTHGGEKKHIPGRYARISPLWCPLRS